MLTVRVTGQPNLEKKFHGLSKALDTREILDEGAALLFNRIRTRFLREQDPDGQPWPPSQAALRRERLGRGGGTLFDTGQMFRSLQVYAAGRTSRSIGTNVTNSTGYPYALAHQFGIGQEKRVFLGFSHNDLTTMTNRVIQRLLAWATA